MKFRSIALMATSVFCLSCSLAALSIGTPSPVDAEKAGSEFNHQLAGCALIGASATMVLSLISPRLRTLRFVWPLFLIALGIFLAAWSDAEIWPRGPLPWTWLIHHDAEARQHKIYSAILIAIGVLEFLRASGRLAPPWRTWAFPTLAISGAMLLTTHAHSGTSGLPDGWKPSQPLPLAAAMAVTTERIPPAVTHEHHHHVHDSPKIAPDTGHHSPHPMTLEMLRIQRQHIWMTIAGLLVAITKFFADSARLRTRFTEYPWLGAMACLGLLLLMYRE